MLRPPPPWLFAVALTACSQASDTPPAPIPPADAPATAPASPDATAPAAGSSAFAGDINAVGTEPFWAVEIRRASLTLTGPDRPDLVVDHGGPQRVGDTAVYEALPDDTALKVTLIIEPCSDGMSDRAYPYVARVETAEGTLKGCAAPAG